MPAMEPPRRVRYEDLTGEDSWSWALRALTAAASAEGSGDAFIDVGLLLQQLEPAALLDIAITLALVPRFGLSVPRTRLDALVCALQEPRS